MLFSSEFGWKSDTYFLFNGVVNADFPAFLNVHPFSVYIHLDNIIHIYFFNLRTNYNVREETMKTIFELIKNGKIGTLI